jgi:threonine dehydratase
MSDGEVTADRVARARAAGADIVRRTPVLTSQTISDRVGGRVELKAENLQRTGSFKLRGALAKLSALGEAGCLGGVVCASAGNHAQAVAYAARARGVPCEVFVPADAPVAKEEAAAALGAVVHRVDGVLEDCLEAARVRTAEGFAFIHPYDDPDVVAGQGTLGLELLEEVPDLARVVVPVGGGGLASGIGIAIRAARPEVELIGVRAGGRPTIADGIAVKTPGPLTGPLLDSLLTDLVTAADDDVADAMVLLLERSKLVVEGAGAVGVAALLSGAVAPAARGTTVAVLSGGNVDAGLLATIVRRHETGAGRRLVLLTRLPDRPGALARLLALVGETGANLVHVEHVREGVELHVRESAVQLVLETRAATHAEDVEAAIAAGGYEARRLG